MLFIWFANPLSRIFVIPDWYAIENRAKYEFPQYSYGDIQELEYDYKFSLSDKKLRKNVESIFQNLFLPHDDNGLPLACITFVLSFFISMDVELKTQFLTNFEGYLPNITIFFLEQLHVGKICNNNYIGKVSYSENYRDAITGIGLGETLYDYSFLKKSSIQVILMWFKYLSESYVEKQQNYFLYTKYSFQNYQEKPNILNSLTYENGKIFYFKNSDFENLSLIEKKKYHLLAMMLEPKVIEWFDNTYDAHLKPIKIEKIEFENNYENIDKTFLEFIISGDIKSN